MTKLGVNIDHIATIRQARKALEPDPVAAAILAELAGADGITVHLRGDRRHIQDSDVLRLRETITTRLNMEMAATDEMIRIALELRPDHNARRIWPLISTDEMQPPISTKCVETDFRDESLLQGCDRVSGGLGWEMRILFGNTILPIY